MDFGCGDGVDLSAVGMQLGLKPEDALGVDIQDGIDADTKAKMTFMQADYYNYESSLQGHMDKLKLKGTVSMVYSIVTFHHVAGDPGMLKAALTFIRDSLEPGGAFVLADWDNPLPSFDLSLFYDIGQHDLNALLFQSPAPTTYPLGYHGTKYLSVAAWEQSFAEHGFKADWSRSKEPVQDAATHKIAWLNSTEMANTYPSRNFKMVFTVAEQPKPKK